MILSFFIAKHRARIELLSHLFVKGQSASTSQSPDASLPKVTLVIPVYNAARYLDECFQSILDQTYKGPIEVSIYDDGCEVGFYHLQFSTNQVHFQDESPAIIERWLPKFKERGMTTCLRRNDRVKGRGCGFAKNRSIEQSSGEYLCFLDSDDVMMPDRVALQVHRV
jgi:cellulose synthase/poly-beta-1,6-N-acetylglucosamine synthase-like glycosyltransferase